MQASTTVTGIGARFALEPTCPSALPATPRELEDGGCTQSTLPTHDLTLLLARYPQSCLSHPIPFRRVEEQYFVPVPRTYTDRREQTLQARLPECATLSRGKAESARAARCPLFSVPWLASQSFSTTTGLWPSTVPLA